MLTPERRAELREYAAGIVGVEQKSMLARPAEMLALLDAADERDRLAAQVERVRAIHSPAPIYLYADECGHDPEVHDVIESITGELMCWDSPTGDDYCTGCGGDPIDELPAHPCETVRALDGADDEASR